MFPADLVTFTKEILNGKLHFFAVLVYIKRWHTNLKLSEKLYNYTENYHQAQKWSLVIY